MLRKLLLSLTIFSLFHVQLSFNVMTLSAESTQAYAETQKESGPLSKTKTVNMETAKLSDDALNILTMMLMGYVLTRLVVMCNPRPADVLVAAGAGAVYVAGEVMALNKFKKMKDKTLDYVVTDDGSGTEEQVKFLLAQRKAYEDVKKTAKTKKTLQMAAAAGIGAAGLMAMFTSSIETPALTTCATCGASASEVASGAVQPGPSQVLTPKNNTAMAASVAQCAAVNSASYGARTGELTQCTLGQKSVMANHVSCGEFSGFSSLDNGSSSKLLSQIESLDPQFVDEVLTQFSMESSSVVLKETLFAEGSLNLLANTNPYFMTAKMTEDDNNILESYVVDREWDRYFDGKLSSISLDDYNKFKNNYYESIELSGSRASNNLLILAANEGIDLIFPSAKAVPMGLAGATAAVAASMLVPFNKTIDMFIASPQKRKYIFGVIAGMAFLAAKSSQKVMDKAQKNIDEIDKIIARLNKWKANNDNPNKGVEGGTHKMLATGGFKKFNNHSPVALTDPNTPMDCIIPSKTKGACGSLSSAIERKRSFGNFPSSLGSIAGSVGGVADSIQGSTSLSSGDLGKIESLANKNAVIQAKLNEKMKEIDPKTSEQIQKGFRNQLNNAVLKTLRKRGMSPSGFLASAGVKAPGPTKDEDKEEVAEYKPVENKGDAVGMPKTGKSPNLDFKLDDSESGFSSEMAENQKAIDILDSSKESKDDIVKDRGVSIFKVMSSRYLKSGYPKLLEELE